MSETNAPFDVAKEQLLAYLYEVASKLIQVEQVEISKSAIDFIAQIPSPDVAIEQLSADQRAVVVAFITEYFPQVVLSEYGLG